MRSLFGAIAIWSLTVLLLLAAGPALGEEGLDLTTVVPEIMGSEQEEGAKLLERADAYWTARVAKQPKVYEFYPSDEVRPKDMKGVPAEGGTVSWNAYAIEAVQVDGDEGVVQVVTEMKLPAEQEARFPESMRKFLKPTVLENWVRLEGVWYKKPVEMGLSRMMKPSRERAEKQRAEAEAKAKAQAKKQETAAATE